jgi:hypothetical protein
MRQFVSKRGLHLGARRQSSFKKKHLFLCPKYTRHEEGKFITRYTTYFINAHVRTLSFYSDHLKHFTIKD